MKLGIVTGHVVSTIKHSIYEGPLLLVHPIDPDGNKIGTAIIALDRVQAGPGDTVLYVDEGNSARTILNDPNGPIRVVTAGIVDRVEK